MTLHQHKDGLSGRDLGIIGDAQYALAGGEIYRRPASHAGSYGGWRWECSEEQARRYPQVCPVGAILEGQL